jgi:hypothetical protein
MRQKMTAVLSLLALVLFVSGCYRLRVDLVDASVQKPSNVALYFSIDDKDDNPVAGISAQQFEIYEDGKLISVYESKQTILNPQVATVRYTLLLLDMSGSVVDSGQVPIIQEAVGEFVSGLGEEEHLAIFAFDGREEIQPIAEYGTTDFAMLKRADKLGSWDGKDPSTNLNGAIIKAVEVLEEAKASAEVPLRFGTLVIFTDGTDRAHRATAGEAVGAMRDARIDSYVIGLGGELDQEEMQRLSTNEIIHVTDKDKVVAAFKEMGQRLKAKGTRYYLLSYCSPSRAGRHELTVKVTVGEEKGKLDYVFDATDFEPDCDPNTTPHFKPMDEALKQEAEEMAETDKGETGKDGKRQVKDKESPIPEKKKKASPGGKRGKDAYEPPPTTY